MVEWWMVTAGANVVMVILYAGIAFLIIGGIAQGREWRHNPVALATAAVFVSCTIGHGLHLAHAVLPAFGIDLRLGLAGRAMFSDWRLVSWDLLTAGVAVYYWGLRNRLAIIYQGASLCEDMVQRQAHARMLNEQVVVALREAEALLSQGRRAEAARAVESTIEASKQIITGLTGEKGSPSAFGPGDLRRQRPSA